MDIEPITQEGFDKLTEEFKYLKDIIKPRVNREKQEAAAQGDRSENAEYHAAKEKLRHIDKRLFFLNAHIQKSKIIDPSILGNEKVHFGSTITLLNVNTDENEVYTICGVLESEPEIGLISIHAPLAKLMLGKGVDDEFYINLVKGKKDYEVEKIEYIPIFELKKTIRGLKDYGYL
ncbi:transcription elongation factor GreA [Sulfurimonas sp. MAG313]|nr:transcription elongation factor GreA [Sulfurimonas sp. MAG313]MDF1879874.1 transcription elongation factor GreA [Sulfurimonas sp. MAG313]